MEPASASRLSAEPFPRSARRSARAWNGDFALSPTSILCCTNSPLYAGRPNRVPARRRLRASNASHRPSADYHQGQRYLDFENPEVCRWWWDAHRGLSGWRRWLVARRRRGPDCASLRGCLGLHNRFDLFRQQAFAEGEASDRPDRRPFLFCRSGGAGMQRFGAACWSGDINNTLTTLEAQPSLGLNIGLSGIPYGEPTSAAFTRSRRKRPSSSCAGSNSARSTRSSVAMAAMALASSLGLWRRDRGDLPALSRAPRLPAHPTQQRSRAEAKITQPVEN